MPLSLVVDNKRGDIRDDEDDPFGLSSLVRRFEESEEASFDARELSERDRRYVDNDQLDEKQIKELEARGQPVVIINRIKRKIDFLVGLEKQQRTRPRALPRTPAHEQDAEACTDALNYVIDDADFKQTRSAVWRNMLVEGIGAVDVCVKGYDDSYAGDANEICIEINRFRWDRFFHDPHSLELDFSDASYLGGVWWMDLEDAVARWPDREEELEATLSEATNSETYDDKPTYQVWADRKRKRLRVVQMWIKRSGGKKADEWFFAEFTKGGILLQGESPYVTDDGDSEPGMVAQSAYADLEGNRFGAVREMISPQDEINKRRSKSLHLLNSNQILYEEGVVDDLEKARSEAARPDGVIKIAPGGLAEQRFQFRERTDLAAGHIQLLQEAKQEIDMMGPNASMQGEAGESASGRAIMASQQGGMIEMGDLLDNLRHFDKRVYRMVWNRIRQYWTGQKWIRITDDERNIRFAAINKPAMTQLPLPTGEVIELPDIDPATGQQRIENNIAQSEVDIYIDDVSDVVAPQIEQWQALVELKKVDVNNEISFEDLIQAAPNIRNKDQILERMTQRKQEAAQQGQPPSPEEQALALKAKEQEMLAAAKVQDHQAKLAMAAQEHQQKLQQQREQHMLEMEIETRKAELKAKTDAALAQKKLDHELVADARKQELTSHYDGERNRQALDHESQRESLKQKAVTDTEMAKTKPQRDDNAKLEKQFAAMAQATAAMSRAMEALGSTIKSVDDGNRQHRTAVATELARVRAARQQPPKG
jgi:hypothetical protein